MLATSSRRPCAPPPSPPPSPPPTPPLLLRGAAVPAPPNKYCLTHPTPEHCCHALKAHLIVLVAGDPLRQCPCGALRAAPRRRRRARRIPGYMQYNTSRTVVTCSAVQASLGTNSTAQAGQWLHTVQHSCTVLKQMACAATFTMSAHTPVCGAPRDLRRMMRAGAQQQRRSGALGGLGGLARELCAQRVRQRRRQRLRCSGGGGGGGGARREVRGDAPLRARQRVGVLGARQLLPRQPRARQQQRQRSAARQRAARAAAAAAAVEGVHHPCRAAAACRRAAAAAAATVGGSSARDGSRQRIRGAARQQRHDVLQPPHGAVVCNMCGDHLLDAADPGGVVSGARAQRWR
ncbi:hypothetical protein JKP88DRAFT_252323 [Tribonema minus]|uniref:Uncharacterized protein n=1 Tax=Tribonema minus TaxID=303371 RepID=A0A835ZDD5_9STRA|nr:hypothetical protein JKP88DRAFT_252323 [Tribonema minus]